MKNTSNVRFIDFQVLQCVCCFQTLNLGDMATDSPEKSAAFFEFGRQHQDCKTRLGGKKASDMTMRELMLMRFSEALMRSARQQGWTPSSISDKAMSLTDAVLKELEDDGSLPKTGAPASKEATRTVDIGKKVRDWLQPSPPFLIEPSVFPEYPPADPTKE